MEEKGPKDDFTDEERIGRRNRRDTLIVTAVFLALVGVAFIGVKLFNPGYSREPYRRVEFVLDDYVTITAYGKDQSRVEEAVDTAFRELFHVQDIADRYRPESELAAVNREAGSHAVKVSEDLWEILETGMEIYRASNGAFDITVGPLVDLWDVVGRGERGDPPPTDEEVAKAREAVGADRLELDAAARTVRFTRPGTVIDVGGLAKGYALDRAAEALRAHGVASGYISMISTDLTLGDKPSGGGPLWRIAVLDPRGEGYLATLLLGGESYISTSGDYQRYFEYGGVRYHHILDPRTGYPARGAVSVTVVGGRNGAWSDGLSTAAFVMGYPEGLQWLQSAFGLECLMVDPSGAVHTTPGMDALLEEWKKSAGS